jgi:hypothetical protein
MLGGMAVSVTSPQQEQSSISEPVLHGDYPLSQEFYVIIVCSY